MDKELEAINKMNRDILIAHLRRERVRLYELRIPKKIILDQKTGKIEYIYNHNSELEKAIKMVESKLTELL